MEKMSRVACLTHNMKATLKRLLKPIVRLKIKMENVRTKVISFTFSWEVDNKDVSSILRAKGITQRLTAVHSEAE